MTFIENSLRSTIRSPLRSPLEDKFGALSLAQQLFTDGQQGTLPLITRTNLRQDVAGTTAVTAHNDPVGLILDPSGNGNDIALLGVDGKRPIYQKVGNVESLLFDGVDDILQSLFTLAQPYNLFFAAQLMEAWAAGNYIIAGGDAFNGLVWQNTSSGEIRGHAGGVNTSAIIPGDNKKFSAHILFNTGSSTIALNNGSDTATSVGAGNPGGVTMGAAQIDASYSRVRFFALGIVAGAMNSTQRSVADSFRQSAIVDPVFDGLSDSGLISEWRFDEANGGEVYDSFGTNAINTNLPTTPNFSWSNIGGNTAGGLIQTPSLTGVRTVMMLYNATAGQSSGYDLSGGISATSGVQGNSHTSTYAVHVGQGNGVIPVAANADGSDAGLLNAGGHKAMFVEFDQARTGALGFGGQRSSTLARVTNQQDIWIRTFDKVLTDGERDTHYAAARRVAQSRGKYIDYRDCPVIKNGILLWGDSNVAASGAVISELSAADQARTYTVDIANNVLEVSDGDFNTLVLGSNHVSGSSTLFGPEIPFANAYVDAGNSKGLAISKTAEGSTYLAPSSDGNVTLGTSWSTDEDKGTAGFYNGALQNAYRQQADAMENGTGIDWQAVFLSLGANDAGFTSTANVHQAQLENLISETRLRLGIADLKFVIVRTYILSPTNPTAYATVRTAQDTVANADANVILIDADGVDMADDLHWSTTGTQAVVDLAYPEIF